MKKEHWGFSWIVWLIHQKNGLVISNSQWFQLSHSVQSFWFYDMNTRILDIFDVYRMIGAIIIGVAYGVQVQPKDDPNIIAASKMYSVLNAALVPGAFFVVRHHLRGLSECPCPFPCCVSKFMPIIYIFFPPSGCLLDSPIHPRMVSRCFFQTKSQILVWDPGCDNPTSVHAGEAGNGEEIDFLGLHTTLTPECDDLRSADWWNR